MSTPLSLFEHFLHKMTVNDYFKKMNEIQNEIIGFIDNDDEESETYFQNFIKKVDLLNIQKTKYEMLSLLYLILNISNNHHQTQNFFEKIIKLISIYKNQIKKDFSDYEIFNIFRNNKKVLLYLIEDNFITISQSIVKAIEKDGNSLYFIDKIQKYIRNSYYLSRIPDNLAEKRKNDFNENYLYELIKKRFN